MNALSAKARVAFGLVGLAISVLLVAAMLDLVPDRVGAVREGRAALAEVLASSSSSWLEGEDLRRAEETLRLAVERSPDLLSAAMRRRDGKLVLEVAAHDGHWQPMAGGHSTDAQLRVPILAGAAKWGELELRFRPLLGEGAAAVLGHPLVLLTAFLAVACFFSFYVYLSKALTQLDPSKAVPGRVRSALDTMAEGLLVIDRSGRVVLANRAFAALVGGSPERLVGMQPADLAFEHADADGAGEARFPWIRALEAGAEEYGVPMRLRDAGGVLRALMVNCSPVMGASGRPGGVLVSFDDVTELEVRGEQLREAKDEADQANRAKSEFLANMSHEIRTPMNAILGFTEVLRRGYHKSERDSRSYLDTIHSSGTHLLELINDILDLSKVEAGHLEVERVACPAHRVIQEVVTVLGVKAREKGVALAFEAEGPLPESVLCDPARLRQIVTNLVGNAIKFTENGGVRITARLDERGEEPVLEVGVHDSGIGIPGDKLDTVFEAFAQADSSVTRRFGGTGLGLAISRRFARAMGGDIAAASTPGEGSTFTLRVPTGPLAGVALLAPAEVAAGQQADGEAPVRSWVFAPARVLMVDDAPENRALLSVVLDGSGLELSEAENGQQALDRATESDFDIVLMDMQMPVMDGYTATRALRARGFAAPVIALTAHAMKGYEQECRAAGCDDFVTKPIDIDRLMQTLAKWLPEQARAAEAPRPQTGAAAVHGPTTMPGPTAANGRSPASRTTAASGPGVVANLQAAGGPGAVDEAITATGCNETAGHTTAPGPGTATDAAAAGTNVATGPAPLPVPSVVAGADAAPVVSPLAEDPRMHAVLRLFASRLVQEMARMRESCEQGDMETLADLGHWLKGSAGTVGYRQFTEPARAMEAQARQGDTRGATVSLAVVEALAERLVVPGADEAAGSQVRTSGPPDAAPASIGTGAATAGADTRDAALHDVATQNTTTHQAATTDAATHDSTRHDEAPRNATPRHAARNDAGGSLTGGCGTATGIRDTTRGAAPAPGTEHAAEPARAGPVISPLAANPRMHGVLRLFGERLAARLTDLGDDTDLEALGDMGHWLRGSAGSVGYGDFTGPATHLEERARAGDAAGAGNALAALRDLAARLELPPEAATAEGR